MSESAGLISERLMQVDLKRRTALLLDSISRMAKSVTIYEIYEHDRLTVSQHRDLALARAERLKFAVAHVTDWLVFTVFFPSKSLSHARSFD